MAEQENYPVFPIYLSPAINSEAIRGRCVFIKFDYHEAMIALIKGIPGAIFRSEYYCWELRYPMIRVFLYQIKRHIASLQIQPQYFIADELKNSMKDYDLSGMNFKSTPRGYQLEGIRYMLQNPRCILGDDPGLGKTLQLLYTAQYLKEYEGLKHVLIICGINGNKYNWEEEVAKHTKYHSAVLGTHKSRRTGRPIDDGTKGILRDLRNPPEATFWIMNIEKLRAGHIARKRGQRKTIDEFPVAAEIQKLINAGEIGLVAFDEFHKCIKGDSTLQVKFGSPKSNVEHMTIAEVYDFWASGANIYVKSISPRGYYCYKHIDKVHLNTPSEKFYKITYGLKYSTVKYEMIISESHRVYLPDAKVFKPISEIRVGSTIAVSSAKRLCGVLFSKEEVRFTDSYCYDLDVDKTHCYFANNLLVHNCKQPTSLQSQALLWLKCPRQVAMTGTLIVNSPLDMYMPFKWLGFEHRDFYGFTNRYAVKDIWGSIIGFQNAQELINVLSVYQLRRLKKSVLSLPPKIEKIEYVELTPDEWKIYDAVHLNLVKALSSGEVENPMGLKHGLFDQLDLSNPLSATMRLRQATASAELLSDVITSSSKLDRMEELCEEIIGNGEKVIIFSNWTMVTNLARKRLEKYSPAYITGEIQQAVRNEERDRFQNDDTCKIMIGTSPALGTGFTLTAATNVIFLDEPWTKAVKVQCEDRAYRIGTTSAVTVYTLIAKSTIDEKVHDIVEEKGDISDFIIDGAVRKEKRSQFLRMLLGV